MATGTRQAFGCRRRINVRELKSFCGIFPIVGTPTSLLIERYNNQHNPRSPLAGVGSGGPILDHCPRIGRSTDVKPLPNGRKHTFTRATKAINEIIFIFYDIGKVCYLSFSFFGFVSRNDWMFRHLSHTKTAV